MAISPAIAAVGERIAFYRRRRWMTQDKLAFTIGMSRPTIANLERGRYQPVLGTFLDIATALGVDPCALLSDPEPQDCRFRSSWALKSAGEEKLRPGRNERSQVAVGALHHTLGFGVIGTGLNQPGAQHPTEPALGSSDASASAPDRRSRSDLAARRSTPRASSGSRPR